MITRVCASLILCLPVVGCIQFLVSIQSVSLQTLSFHMRRTNRFYLFSNCMVLLMPSTEFLTFHCDDKNHHGLQQLFFTILTKKNVHLIHGSQKQLLGLFKFQHFHFFYVNMTRISPSQQLHQMWKTWVSEKYWLQCFADSFQYRKLL